MNGPVRIKGYDEIIEALDDAKKIAGYLSDAYVNTLKDLESWKKGCEDANKISQRFEAENVKLRAEIVDRDDAEKHLLQDIIDLTTQLVTCNVYRHGSEEDLPHIRQDSCVDPVPFKYREAK